MGPRHVRLHEAARVSPLLGTQLMFAGLEQGNRGEAWNLTYPERVLAIQHRYAKAGSEAPLQTQIPRKLHEDSLRPAHAQPFPC
jgi:hypothetical protein